MRLSCRKDDPGYDEEAIIKEYEFTCDGKVVEYVITIDEEKGFIFCYALDDNGKPKRTEDGNNLQTMVLRGKVKIREV